MDDLWGPPASYNHDFEQLGQHEFDAVVSEIRAGRGMVNIDDSDFESGLRYYRDVLALGK
ncbi:hypothetical protein C8263_10720 [Deinococcus arcticus]|uniref:Uncharacterized protein n=2 Tax=Deinococcus arcticus TaxID=2136176 RepID=A0A2T3W7H8_9DEIO|nr:hypothetical protein C8263_10720 [Deinococcus arcticus]